MPRNPNGEYVLPSIYLAASGQTIRADQHNIPMQDIAQALTGSVARNGSTPMTGNLPMNSNRITGLAAATASSDAVRLDQVTKYSGYLNAVSGLALAANEITYATGPASAAGTALTPFGRGWIAAADAAAGRTALELGPLATATIVPVDNGGTGANNATSARASLSAVGYVAQSLTTAQKDQARGNIEANTLGAGSGWAVRGPYALGTLYTNNTGYPLLFITGGESGGGLYRVRVNGGDRFVYSGVGFFANEVFVPDGWTFQAEQASGTSLSFSGSVYSKA